MKNGMFVPATRIQGSPDVKNDGKARVDTSKPTLTQQGIDVDEFISETTRSSKDSERGRIETRIHGRRARRTEKHLRRVRQSGIKP
nr:MAG TPA: hypothetical protein [Caudoviricetes sp.]